MGEDEQVNKQTVDKILRSYRFSVQDGDVLISKAMAEQTHLVNLGQLLHILHSGFLKQRTNRNIEEKAKSMQLVLTNAPQLLNLVDVLTSLNKGKIQGRVWASNTVQDKEFLPQELPDIGHSYDDMLAVLKSKHK